MSLFRFRYNIDRILTKYHDLPSSVDSAYTTDICKARLDKFWHSQDIVYDFRAQLQGTGSRSDSSVRGQVRVRTSLLSTFTAENMGLSGSLAASRSR